jgi:hypothetical protein
MWQFIFNHKETQCNYKCSDDVRVKVIKINPIQSIRLISNTCSLSFCEVMRLNSKEKMKLILYSTQKTNIIKSKEINSDST